MKSMDMCGSTVLKLKNPRMEGAVPVHVVWSADSHSTDGGRAGCGGH